MEDRTDMRKGNDLFIVKKHPTNSLKLLSGCSEDSRGVIAVIIESLYFVLLFTQPLHFFK